LIRTLKEDYIRQDYIQMLMGFFDFFCKKKKEELESTPEPDKEESTPEPDKEESTPEPDKEESTPEPDKEESKTEEK